MALLEVGRGEDGSLAKLLRRPETTWQDLIEREPALAAFSAEVATQVTYDVKYAGYIARQEVEVERHGRLAQKRIPAAFDFTSITHLRAEAREKLVRFRPQTVAQASRISGITPADLALLVIHLGGR
jgi:tRNA uridine 5-carboxymethylaminomethyl modification enzyme